MENANESLIEDIEVPEVPGIAAGESPSRVIPADEGIEGLKQQLAAEKSRREAAERQAREAATEVYKAKTEVADTQLSLISNAIETVKSHSSSLKAEYAQAMAAGDYSRAADVQEQMSRKAAELLALENGRQSMTERPKTAPPAESDSVEAFASQLTPRSASWIRSHPEYVTDRRLHNKMIRAHQDAMDEGIPADTKDYFEHVENILGLNRRRQEPDDDGEEIDGKEYAAKPSRAASPPAAPVSRSSPSTDGTRRGTIRLSAVEREIARANYMTDEQYWKQKQAIAREKMN